MRQGKVGSCLCASSGENWAGKKTTDKLRTLQVASLHYTYKTILTT
jgi:hypothetical protein